MATDISTTDLKTHFKARSIPMESDFVNLIDIADIGRLATGQSPGQPLANSNTGLYVADDKRLAVNPRFWVGVAAGMIGQIRYVAELESGLIALARMSVMGSEVYFVGPGPSWSVEDYTYIYTVLDFQGKHISVNDTVADRVVKNPVYGDRTGKLGVITAAVWDSEGYVIQEDNILSVIIGNGYYGTENCDLTESENEEEFEKVLAGEIEETEVNFKECKGKFVDLAKWLASTA